ncbi:hypothetical protein SLEP1_g43393 [Rubroshorea leprosula]|uniref:Uncharacterized protein n=1 Tax=Rubroshorea leprosula TaxID=152421 RepID=A0AAV5LDT6_9ROSI|nr:hypothetical protein SLEP1_g43393 [Rubroshorea leprosula]
MKREKTSNLADALSNARNKLQTAALLFFHLEDLAKKIASIEQTEHCLFVSSFCIVS